MLPVQRCRMLTPSTDFFTLAEEKLDWLDTRTRVLAGNIANSDTPGFHPRDLQPFASLLPSALSLTSTNEAHISASPISVPGEITMAGEHAPDGNAVSVEQQMKLVADTNSEQQLTTTLYKKYIGMMTTALGGGLSS